MPPPTPRILSSLPKYAPAKSPSWVFCGLGGPGTDPYSRMVICSRDIARDIRQLPRTAIAGAELRLQHGADYGAGPWCAAVAARRIGRKVRTLGEVLLQPVPVQHAQLPVRRVIQDHGLSQGNEVIVIVP